MVLFVQKNLRMYQGEEQCAFLLRLLKDRYDINNVGIYLDNGRRVDRRTLEKYLGWYSYNIEIHKAARKQIKKDGFCTITNAGFNEYYIMPMGKFQWTPIPITVLIQMRVPLRLNGHLRNPSTRSLVVGF